MIVAGYILYHRFPSNPAIRSSVLYPMLFSSIFIWTLLGASLLLCTAFLNQYTEGGRGIVRLVFGSSLVASLGVSGLMTVLARRFAFPRALRRMTGDSGKIRSLEEPFGTLVRKMGVRADLAEAVVGNAFSVSVGGRNLVAMSSDMVQYLTFDETEAVLAHELSHIKNRDSLAKGLARLAHIAFPFDPTIRLVEAAMHRERELLADRDSARYTHQPLALASALLKACKAPVSSASISREGLCVGGSSRGLLNLYPDIDKRIDMLVDLDESMKNGQTLNVASDRAL